MKITKAWLKKRHACAEGIKFVTKIKLVGLEPIPFIKKLMKFKKLFWANWLIVRVMNKMQRVAYAIFAAEQVIDNFEKEYPKDKRPRKAIEAAKKYLDDPNEENRNAVERPALAAYAAWMMAWSAPMSAACAAESAAVSAARSAARAVKAAAAAAEAAEAGIAMLDKILNHGLKLLEKDKK